MTDNEITQPPPHDFRAEQAVLGGMFFASSTNTRVLDEVQQILHGPEDFYTARHQDIYAAILDLYGSGKPIDPITLAAQMREAGSLARIGGASYLHELAQAVPTVAHAPHYAQNVRDCAFRRALVTTCTAGRDEAYNPTSDPAQVAETITEQVQRIVSGATESVDRFWASDHAEVFLDQLESTANDPIIRTAWPDLDTVVKLRAGQLVIVGARPGGGKSVLGLNLAVHTALKHQMAAVLFSMEMGGDQVMARCYADQARIPLGRLEERNLNDDEWQRMAQATARIAEAPLSIDDTPRLSLGRLRARLRQMEANGRPARVVIVDYIQLMQTDPAWGRQRWEQLGTLSRELKILAGEFNVLVVALTQMNRNPETRADKKPSMGDLRESGSFENDANVVLLLHKDPPNSEGEPQQGRIDVIVAKNRQGQSQVTVPLVFQGKYQRLVSQAKGPKPCAEQMAYVAAESMETR
ncbi:replicative DNA helicase [Streptomyces sp. NPDC057838]|uniref:replicative DNA helicase n=1 Tax=unclassified Streptomyces TaxID=2593676 RepID=UPI003698142F